jgi:hypothetical protein
MLMADTDPAMLVKTTEYAECQAFYPVVGIGPPPSHPQKCCLPPFGSDGGDTLVCGRGGGGPDSDDGTDTLIL